MSRYTLIQDPAADLSIDDALQYVVKEIVTLMGASLDSIMLTGSFGRGEGRVVLENNCYRPVNDFDIVVVVSRKFIEVKRQYQRQLTELAERVSKQVGVKQIDVGITHPFRFRFATNLVSNYEVKHGHQVLYGHIDLKRIMPKLPAAKLPLLDGSIYFHTRGSGLLLPALYFLPLGRIQERNRENFQIEIDKAQLAMGDALLLMYKRYHFSYTERRRRLLEDTYLIDDVPSGKFIRDSYLNAIDRRLSLCFTWPGDEEMVQQWFMVRDCFSKFFLWFESCRLGREFQSWKAYSAYVQTHTHNPLIEQARSIIRGGTQLGKRKPSECTLKFGLSTMPMVLFSLYMDTHIDSNLLDEGRRLLGLPSREDGFDNWLEATHEYLRIFHPSGVVAEAIRDVESS